VPPVIKVTATIAVGARPAGVATDPKTDTIYVTNIFSGTVSVISGRTNTVVATIAVGNSPLASIPGAVIELRFCSAWVSGQRGGKR